MAILETCLFVSLFWMRNRICPTGSTPKGGPMEISPTTQATRHPQSLSFFMFPVLPYFCQPSCIRSVASSVFLSCTYIQVSGLSLPCLPVLHIYLNPTKMNPSTLQTSHINCVSLLFPKQFQHQCNYLPWTVSSMPTCSSSPHYMDSSCNENLPLMWGIHLQISIRHIIQLCTYLTC